VNILVIFFT